MELLLTCPICKEGALVEIPSYKDYPKTKYLICWKAKHLFTPEGKLIRTYKRNDD